MEERNMNKLLKECLVVLICFILGIGLFVIFNADKSIVYAEQENVPTKTQTVQIRTTAYKLEDNTGYNESEDKKVNSYSHPLKKNLINLSVYTQSNVSTPAIDKGVVTGYNAYGITGNYVAIQLSYNFDNSQNLYQRQYYDSKDKTNKTEVYSISNDTSQQVGNIERLGVVGTGAVIFQKKTEANKSWEWQTKDGDTKKSLHTVNFTDVVPLEEYSKGEMYTLYTPSGADLSKGVFIKITFAYEIKVTTSWDYVNFWGITKTKSETNYINMLETAEFYLVQNSGAVLFHNASNFDKVGDDDGSGAISIDDFETILSGDVTLNGFRIDTLGVEAYDIKYRFNGGEEHTAYDGEFFFNHGRYDFTIIRKIGPSIKHTIFVDRREVNDAVVGYFGQSLFTPDSQRIYTTGEYPTYIAGKATWNLNATDGTVVPVVGQLCKIDDEGNEIFIRKIAQSYKADYKTATLQGTIDEVGIYKAEFWGNPRYLDSEDISGDLYHFTFRFEIVDKNTSIDPSVNEAYLNGLLSFSDMQSKYYAVIMPTAGVGNAIFAFSDFGGAYNFAYEIERSKIKVQQDKYEYNDKTYSTQKAVLTAVDEIANTLVIERYFDATNPESYQTADITNDKVLEMNFTKDVIVFLNDDEQSYMQAGLPSLNGRKYRYVSPDTGEVQEGVIDFVFLKIADFESNTVTLTHKATNVEYEINYGVSVEYQLGVLNAPSGVYTVSETNSYGAVSTYEAMYIRPGEMAGEATFSLFRGGKFEDKTFSKSNTLTESGLSGFILKSLTNDLDIYSIVKINHNNETTIYMFNEVEDMWFSEGGVYDFTLVDRLGNSIEFSLIISNPVGYADVYLQLEQEDEEIIKYYHVFVGQEIQLPTPKLTSELFVFDGWLYEDEIIIDNVFVPTKSGTLYVWQQITQKYTYLNFDVDGGELVDSIKVEIGEPIELPLTSKEGWTFGGWVYGGKVYDGEYIPTSASPTFVAIWNYQITQIELYDGNLTQRIEAHVGDKVILPFPTRTGYTFFGWREQEDDNQNKVYYGQITSLANIEYLRLDALWIRQSNENFDALPNATGGRTIIHFVDGDLLQNDSLQGVAGTTISLPNVTRAGFIFIGWIWEKTSTSGKIYNSTMTIPSDAGNKIVLQSLWIARGITAAQSENSDTAVAKTSGIINSVPSSTLVALGGMICMLGFMLIICLVCIVSKKGKAFDSNATTISIYGREAFSDKQSVRQRRIRRYGAITLFTAILLVVIISFLSAFGGWGDLGIFQKFNNDVNVTPVESERIDNDVIGNTFELNNNSATNEVMPTKEEVKSNIQDSGILDNDKLDLTDEEAFLYSLIMMDLYSLGYLVFPSEAILPNKEHILGLGYSDYESVFNSSDEADKTLYIGSGFVALPRQVEISESDIEDGIYLEVLYDESELSNNELSDLDKYSYIISFTESYGPCHYIADGQYVTYSVEKCDVKYTSVKANEEVYDAECGALHDYDLGRIVFDPSLDKNYEIKATSLNTILDPVIAENEYKRYIAEQTANGFTVDTMNYVFISYEALQAYELGGQDESLLGIDLQEYYDIEKTLGANEYYAVDKNGNLTKLEFPPNPEETKKQWINRIKGAALGVGIILAGIIVSTVVSVVFCGAGSTIAPIISGAAIGAGIEILMQTLVQGKGIDEINWTKVCIATISGAACAIPGVGMITAGLIQGLTEAAFVAVDGGSIEDVALAFTVGFATSMIIQGMGKALKSISQCFVAGTGVLMANGTTMAIENIRVGDMVKSYNPVTGKVANKRVLRTYVNNTDELVTVSTSDGQQVTSTPGHKFYANNNWVSAEDLRAGDILVNVNGEKVVVEQIQHDILDNSVKVYNFEVADNHTYFVGYDKGIAVHNKDCAVYFGKNKLTGKDYVGRTNNVPRRMNQHKNINNKYRRDLVDVDYLGGLTKDQSKILEQALINDKGGTKVLDNAINGMSESNKLHKYLATDGKKLLEDFYKNKIRFTR